MEDVLMSSEETVEDQDLAQEALDATEEASPAEEPQMVPVAKHAALRQRAQQAEIAAARLEGELAAIKSLQTREAPATLSPVQIRAKEEGVEVNEVQMDYALYQAQQQYDQQLANQRVEVERKQQLGVLQLSSANKARAMHEDWGEVVKTGETLLTKGELVDIAAAGADFGDIAYAKCKAAIDRAKPETKPVTETVVAAPETKKSSESGVVPTRSEILKGLNVDPITEAASLL